MMYEMKPEDFPPRIWPPEIADKVPEIAKMKMADMRKQLDLLSAFVEGLVAAGAISEHDAKKHILDRAYYAEREMEAALWILCRPEGYKHEDSEAGA